MSVWLSGPRLLNGLVRPGVSFGPSDLDRRVCHDTNVTSCGTVCRPPPRRVSRR